MPAYNLRTTQVNGRSEIRFAPHKTPEPTVTKMSMDDYVVDIFRAKFHCESITWDFAPAHMQG